MSCVSNGTPNVFLWYFSVFLFVFTWTGTRFRSVCLFFEFSVNCVCCHWHCSNTKKKATPINMSHKILIFIVPISHHFGGVCIWREIKCFVAVCSNGMTPIWPQKWMTNEMPQPQCYLIFFRAFIDSFRCFFLSLSLARCSTLSRLFPSFYQNRWIIFGNFLYQH